MHQLKPGFGVETIVLAEGRRMMRLREELAADVFAALLSDYQRVVRGVFEARGGSDIGGDGDTVMATFASPKEGALAAVAVQRALTAHDWPAGLRPSASIGLDSAAGGVDIGDAAPSRCSDLCDAAEGGQIFVSEATAALLEREELGALSVRDLGEQQTRRTQRTVRAYELVVPDSPSFGARAAGRRGDRRQ